MKHRSSEPRWNTARWALVGVLLASAVMAAAFKLKGEGASRKTSAGDAPAPTSAAVSADEHARIDALTKRIAWLEARLSARDEMNARAASPEAPPAATSEPERRSPAEIQAEQHQAAERQRAELEEVFATEPTDPAWAPEFERSIRGVLSEEAFAGSSPTTIACRETLCRVELNHSDEDAQERFGEVLAIHKPAVSQVWGTRIDEGNGRFHSVVYLVRKGSAIVRSAERSPPGDLR